MQNKQSTSQRIRAHDYVTVVQQACDKVTNLTKLHSDLEQPLM